MSLVKGTMSLISAAACAPAEEAAVQWYPWNTCRVISELVFTRPDFPRELEIQVLDFMRMEWPVLFTNQDRLRDHLWEDKEALHFVRSSGDLLISHVQVLSLEFQNAGTSVRIGGVASVLTYPQFRGEGHASALMRLATEHIRSAALDVGILFCDLETVPFYQRFGWRALPRGRVLVGGSEPEDVVMIVGHVGAVPDPLDLDWQW